MKTFLSIGTGPGIGFATAERFAREGFRVVLSARDITPKESRLMSTSYSKSIILKVIWPPLPLFCAPASLHGRHSVTGPRGLAKKSGLWA